MWVRLVLTFDVMPQNRSIVVLPSLDSEGGGGVRLPTLVPRNHLNLPPIPVLALRDVKMPHSVVDQLVSASLNEMIDFKVFLKNVHCTLSVLSLITISLSKYK